MFHHSRGKWLDIELNSAVESRITCNDICFSFLFLNSSMGGSNNLGPVMNANNTSGNGGNSNWDQSQRMRGKVRYGNRHGNTNRTSKHQQQQQQQHQGGGNMLQLGNTAGNSIPSINKSQVCLHMCIYIAYHYL